MQTWLKAVLLAVTLSCGALPIAGRAAEFESQEIEQNQYVAITSPYGKDSFGLIILQQLPKGKPCWQETGSNPTTVDPLLLQFNFKGSCSRFTDSNGYSLRIGGQDVGLKYTLRIVRFESDIYLLGVPAIGTQGLPILFIGRTNGDTAGFAKFNLNPGWRFARRAFKGKAVGHVYLLNDSPLQDLAQYPNPTERKQEQPITPATTPVETSPSVAQPVGIPSAPINLPASNPAQVIPSVPQPVGIPSVPINLPTSVEAAPTAAPTQ